MGVIEQDFLDSVTMRAAVFLYKKQVEYQKDRWITYTNFFTGTIQSNRHTNRWTTSKAMSLTTEVPQADNSGIRLRKAHGKETTVECDL